MSGPDRIFAKGTRHPHPGMEGHVVVFASVVQTYGTVEYVLLTPQLAALIEAAKLYASQNGDEGPGVLRNPAINYARTQEPTP